MAIINKWIIEIIRMLRKLLTLKKGNEKNSKFIRTTESFLKPFCRNSFWDFVALIKASKEGDLQRVKELVEDGAQVNWKDDWGGWSLVDGLGWTPLHAAARNGHQSIVHFLVINGGNANCNERTNAGDTPLHEAAWNGHMSVVQYLIEAGADKGIKNEWEMTAYDRASVQNHREVADFLRK